jgi:hypothetical protein
MSSIINFSNAIATLKEGATINEEALRGTTVYAKLMMKSGMKFDNVKSPDDFLHSTKGDHISAELFVITKSNSMLIDERLWLNVDKNATIMRDNNNRMFFVELIHPTVDLSSATVAFPKKGGK